MTAFPGSFSYFQLLNLDQRDILFWVKRAVHKILNRQINDLMTARVGADLEGKFWSEQVNRLLAIKKQLDIESGDKKKEPGKLAPGWGFFKVKKTG